MNGKMVLQKEKMMIKKITLVLFMISLSTGIFAQAREFNSPKAKSKSNASSKKFEFDPDNLVFGGNLGATFGEITLVEVSPTVGYLFSENWLVGISTRYIYFEDRTFPSFTYKTNIYGGGVFSQYFFLENFIAHAEYELLNLEDNSRFGNGERINISSVFIGGGFRSDLGGNSFVSVLLLYNLNETTQSPYTNPVLRVGFGIGL